MCGLNAVQVFVGHGDVHERLADHAEAIARLAGRTAPAFGCDFTDFLPAGTAEPVGLGLPPDSDQALIGVAQPERETLYSGVAEALRRARLGRGRRAGGTGRERAAAAAALPPLTVSRRPGGVPPSVINPTEVQRWTPGSGS